MQLINQIASKTNPLELIVGSMHASGGPFSLRAKFNGSGNCRNPGDAWVELTLAFFYNIDYFHSHSNKLWYIAMECAIISLPFLKGDLIIKNLNFSSERKNKLRGLMQLAIVINQIVTIAITSTAIACYINRGAYVGVTSALLSATLFGYLSKDKIVYSAYSAHRLLRN